MNKSELRRKFKKGSLFFADHVRHIKTPDYREFINEIVAPLSGIYFKELEAEESPETVTHFKNVCASVSGHIVKVKLLRKS